MDSRYLLRQSHFQIQIFISTLTLEGQGVRIIAEKLVQQENDRFLQIHFTLSKKGLKSSKYDTKMNQKLVQQENERFLKHHFTPTKQRHQLLKYIKTNKKSDYLLRLGKRNIFSMKTVKKLEKK